MTGMTAAANARGATWSLRDAGLVFAMWTVMMAAMMLPSVGPTLEMHARIARGHGAGQSRRTCLFASSYLITWTGFAAAIAQ